VGYWNGRFHTVHIIDSVIYVYATQLIFEFHLTRVPNTDSFRNSVSKSYNPHASHFSARRRGRRITNFQDATLRNSFIQCQEQYIKHGNLTKAAQDFNDVMLKEYPPVFYWWFVRNFQDPHKWFEARTRFALSAAAWAAVGHVIGLGDRHSENILLDTSCGECVHVDFDCIFDKGLNLPRPEVIPFRLTPNMLDGFGPTGAEGAFTGGLKSAMAILRDNRDLLLSVLDPFLRDPVIDWKRQRHKEKENSEVASNSNDESDDAKRSIRVIDERLRGIYNLKNPNSKKIKRVDRKMQDSHDEMASMLPLSVEGQVHKMIAEATSHENLVQIYVGWMPWL
jgi:serine/threonine-protein kinase ATR